LLKVIELNSLSSWRPAQIVEQEMTTGYLHAAYADSLAEFGTPRLLPQSAGWILEREIPNTPHHDAMGCYPLFACHDWSRLSSDLDNIGDDLVCLSVVTDPFGEYAPDVLNTCFPDLVIPFKEHFIVDLSQDPATFVTAHHQRNVDKALREIRVELCDGFNDLLDDWTTLYAELVKRHNITGLAAFSKDSFAKQLRVPGIVVLRAVHNDATIGMLMWYQQEDRAYYHLGAYNSRGYELGASFALFDYAIKYFAERELAWLNLGSGAGVAKNSEEGLSRFKQGWATGTRTAFFCGRIFDQDSYREAIRIRQVAASEYFPAYRSGEFR
jgi:hypothetical protein